jgi:hypothetical protein
MRGEFAATLRKLRLLPQPAPVDATGWQYWIVGTATLAEGS